MKSKIFGLMSLSVLALVILAGVVSSAISLVPDTIQINASHDSSSTFTFQIDNTYDDDPAVNNQTLIDLVSSKTNLISATNIINSENLIIGALPVQIAPESISSDISVTLNIPEYTTPGIYTGTFDIDGDVVDSDPANPTADIFTINLHVLETPELSVSSSEIAQGEDSTTVTITNEGNADLIGIELISADEDFEVSFEPSESFDLTAGEEKEIIVTITSDVDDLELGSNSVTITATDDVTNATGEVTIEKSFCDCDNEGDLEISIKDITNRGFSNEKFGDEDEWFPLDEIEVEIEVENKGDYDVDDIEVVWGLYDEDNKEWLIEEEEKDFNLADGKEKTITVSFKLEDVDDLGNNEDYVLYVKATGNIDSDDEYDGDETCASDSENIKVIIENDFVVVYNVEFPEIVQCGAEVQILADVWNIGEDDQDEVLVYVINTELGISEQVEIGDIDAFDDEKLEVTVKIPQNADEKWYSLTFLVYDDDDDLYETDHDDDEAKFRIPIKVSGNCEVESTALVSPVLESGGEAGQELVVKATITNTGTEMVNYVLSATETDWASSVEFDESTIILGAGESKDVLVTLNVNEDASGEKEFNINVFSSDGELITKQPVSVLIEDSEGFDFSGLMQDNWYLWIIGAVNIILVIIIILVAVRVAKR